jgi:hypothetical protein
VDHTKPVTKTAEDVSSNVEEESLPASLPAGIMDIDSKDKENPQICGEYAQDMYAYLRQLERGLVIRKNFLQGCAINGKMRAVLVDWLVEVHGQFKLLQETLYMSVFILDCYLQVDGLWLKRNQLQLVGVTSMFIASKVEEMYAPEINDFVYITDRSYSAEEIRAMELKILHAINFKINRPLPLHFLRRNSKAGDVDVLQHGLAKYFMELTLPEYEIAHQPPSLVAAACLFLSLRLLEPSATLASVWTPVLEAYSTYSRQDLMGLVFKVSEMVVKVDQSKLQAVRTKYKSKKFLKVAELEELCGQVVTKLAAKDIDGL